MKMLIEQGFELINNAVIQGVFTEDEANQKEGTLKKLLSNTPSKQKEASVESYFVRNVLLPYNKRVSESR